ncbi:hypothetical protein ACLOJK_002199 [Asimina triloba]
MAASKRASTSTPLLISSTHPMPKKRRIPLPPPASPYNLRPRRLPGTSVSLCLGSRRRSRMTAAAAAAEEDSDQNPLPQTSTSTCGDNGEINWRRREQGNSSSVVLRVYCRRRRHLNQTSDQAAAAASSSSHQSVFPQEEKEKEEAGAPEQQQEQPRKEMCGTEPKEAELPTSSSSSSSPSFSQSLQQAEQGQGKKAGDIFHPLSASPYLDFEDFKRVTKIQLNQIWALNDHGHVWAPRTYARIHRFLPTQFKVEVALLDFHPTCDVDASWCERNLPLACGTFKQGKSMLVRDVCDLSHRAIGCEEEGERSERSLFHRILPRKGQVWAIYKDWNPQWSQSDYKQHLSNVKLVEIMSDLSEVDGIFVAALVPAEACLTIFQRQTHEGFGLFQWIPKSLLLHFSHRVVAVGMSKGSWLIDPVVAPIPFKFNIRV